MNEERDAILRVRAKVDSYDEWHELFSDPPIAGSSSPTVLDRVVLCSPQRAVLISVVASAITREFSDLSNFTNQLARFFKKSAVPNVSHQSLNQVSVSKLSYQWQNL